MTASNLGETLAVEGQLLVLYVESMEDKRHDVDVVLYVRSTFNLSEQMATYHREVMSATANMRSEKVIREFVQWLTDKGLVTEPSSSHVSVGAKGRPPVRIIDEYKYQMNPAEFVFDKLKALVKSQTGAYVNSKGGDVVLLDPAATDDELLLEVFCDGEPIGFLHVGLVIGTERLKVIDHHDISEIRTSMEALFNKHLPEHQFTIGRVLLDRPPYSNVTVVQEALSC